MKLDTTKVYYLGDLSDEQKTEVFNWLIINDKGWNNFLDSFLDVNNKYIEYNGTEWLFDYSEEYTNALTLFETNKNERIAQIQLRIQELNNELIELDEEMRKLTYDKKED